MVIILRFTWWIVLRAPCKIPCEISSSSVAVRAHACHSVNSYAWHPCIRWLTMGYGSLLNKFIGKIGDENLLRFDKSYSLWKMPFKLHRHCFKILLVGKEWNTVLVAAKFLSCNDVMSLNAQMEYIFKRFVLGNIV